MSCTIGTGHNIARKRRKLYVDKFGELNSDDIVTVNRTCKLNCINVDHFILVPRVLHLSKVRRRVKLTVSDKETIWASLLPDSQLAERYGCSESTIRRIKLKRRGHNPSNQ